MSDLYVTGSDSAFITYTSLYLVFVHAFVRSSAFSYSYTTKNYLNLAQLEFAAKFEILQLSIELELELRDGHVALHVKLRDSDSRSGIMSPIACTQ